MRSGPASTNGAAEASAWCSPGKIKAVAGDGDKDITHNRFLVVGDPVTMTVIDQTADW
jgi:hypothetical protein